MSSKASIVWFRQDLRLADNPAVQAAVERGEPVIPLYIWAPEEEGDWPPGSASRWWLHQSLKCLDAALRKVGSRLILRAGTSVVALRDIIGRTKATAVIWNSRYEPAAIRRDRAVESALKKDGITVHCFNGSLLDDPAEIQTGGGTPYKVFTPFWKACLAAGAPAEPLPAPKRLVAPGRWPTGEKLKSFRLEPEVDWTDGLHKAWKPGEAGAQVQLKRFLSEAMLDYAEHRDRPDRPGTSRLSPYLHFGEISPHQVWHAVSHQEIADGRRGTTRGAEAYIRQLYWREFAYYLLFHFPETPTRPLRDAFERFPWRKATAQLRAWQQGQTGYPTVDAAMRELWATGWMHNRMRMLAASFLTKDLRIHWLEGARWFWDTLVDADLANNTFGWQWTAGCGADAAPYFRIFNPISQGQRFDPDGNYVRRWAPELSRLPASTIHQPWKTPERVLITAGVRIGRNYPRPIVDHRHARGQALEAYEVIKSKSVS